MCVCVLFFLCLADRKVMSGVCFEVRGLSNSWSCTEESKGRATGISGLRGFLEMLLVGHGTSGKLFNPQCSPVYTARETFVSLRAVWSL